MDAKTKTENVADIDEIDPAKLFNSDDVTDDQLVAGSLALQGKTVKQMTSPKAKTIREAEAKSPRPSADNPIDQTDDSDADDSDGQDDDNAEDKDAEEMAELGIIASQIETLFLELEKNKKIIAAMEDALSRQALGIKQLEKTTKLQEATIKTLTAELEYYKVDTPEKIAKVEDKLRNKIDDAMSAVSQTPDIVDRLVQATSQVIAHLPDDTQKTLSKVELTPNEVTVMRTIKAQVASPKKKLPKHLR